MSTPNSTATHEDSTGGQTPGGPNDKPPKNILKHYLESVWHTLTKSIVLILTLGALALSMVQYRQASKAEEEGQKRAAEAKVENQRLVDQYKLLSESISTQYVNVFPQNMPAINLLLEKKTTRSLTIVVDVAGYGHFSNPADSRKYLAELDNLSQPERKINIQLICYDSPAAKAHLYAQFGWADLVKKYGAGAWDEFKKRNEDKFVEYKRYHESEMPDSMEDLVTQIDNAGVRLRNLLINRGAAVRVTSEDLPIFMWISDGQEAIFSFHTYGQNPREHSFKTTDHGYIYSLKDIEGEAVRQSHTYSPENKGD